MSSSMPTYDGKSEPKTKISRIVLYCILISMAVLLFMQFYIPRLTANRIANSIQTEWGIPVKPDVEVKAFPFFRIWAGRMDQIIIRGSHALPNGLHIEEWEMRLFQVVVQESPDGKPMFGFQKGEGYAVISETAIESFIRDRSPGIINPRVMIADDHIFYGGQWGGGILNIAFSISGYPYIHEDGEIRIKFERITVGPFNIPDMIRDVSESFAVLVLQEEQGLFSDDFGITGIDLSEGVIRVQFSKDEGF